VAFIRMPNHNLVEEIPMNRPHDTHRRARPSRPAREQITPGGDAAVVAQWQRVVDLLEDAARACDARDALHAEQHAEQQGRPVFDWWIGRFDGETVRSAADELRLAAPASLPVSFPVYIVGPAGRAAGPAWADIDTDPLPLLERAWEQLGLLPDDPANVALLEATLAVADASTAVRSHYE